MWGMGCARFPNHWPGQGKAAVVGVERPRIGYCVGAKEEEEEESPSTTQRFFAGVTFYF